MNLSKKITLITMLCFAALTLCNCSIKKDNKVTGNTTKSIIKENYFSDLSPTEYNSITSTDIDLFSDENNNTIKISEYVYDDTTNMAYVEISMCGNNIGKTYLDATDNNSDSFICTSILEFNNTSVGITTTDIDSSPIIPERYHFDKDEIKFVYKLSDFSGEIILWKYEDIKPYAAYDKIPASTDRTSYDFDGEILNRTKLESTVDNNSSYIIKNDTYEVSVSKLSLTVISNETTQSNTENDNASSEINSDIANVKASTSDDIDIELEYSDGSRKKVTYSHMYGSAYDNGKCIKTYIFKNFIKPEDISSVYINNVKIEN